MKRALGLRWRLAGVECRGPSNPPTVAETQSDHAVSSPGLSTGRGSVSTPEDPEWCNISPRYQITNAVWNEFQGVFRVKSRRSLRSPKFFHQGASKAHGFLHGAVSQWWHMCCLQGLLHFASKNKWRINAFSDTPLSISKVLSHSLQGCCRIKQLYTERTHRLSFLRDLPSTYNSFQLSLQDSQGVFSRAVSLW